MPLSHRRTPIHYTLFPPHMRPLFFGTLLYSCADQLVGVFLPLFLFGIGAELSLFMSWGATPFTSGVLLAVIYYALQRAVVLVSAFPLGLLIARVGYNWGMILGTIFLMFNYVGFYFARTSPSYLMLSFVAGGMGMLLYWVSHDSLFAKEVRIKEIGRGVGAITFLTKLLQIAIPAVSGILIAAFGYHVLFVVGLVILVVSCIPFLLIPNTAPGRNPSLAEFLSWMRERRYVKFALVQLGKYMDIVAVLLWPIYVLVFVGRIERVGFIFSLAFFISLILTYLAGWFFDHKKGRRMFVASGAVVSLAWFLKLFVRGIWDIVGVEFLEKLAASVYTPCYDAFLCTRSKGKTVMSFYLYKEILLSLSSLILWGGVIVLLLVPVRFSSLFILGTIGVFLSLFLDGRK